MYVCMYIYISNYLHNIENIIIFNNKNVVLAKYIKVSLIKYKVIFVNYRNRDNPLIFLFLLGRPLGQNDKNLLP